ncbi:FAD-dependent monooxygenase [Methylobacterium sp. Leaf93]|uniref:FAD-dependent monooxygenase n=1 Tax=Methylobacterium sp. Leaf93 TaxID=1736249 RepID=UPI0006FA6FAD|nr:FAD-dependent monooxygenase [Methylobacterium sp. Leaf93]KQP15760.1 FAD-binding monooxygenase [Methylobacterium sp. Leaf93]
MLQALIVGAGPVGLTLAAELARYGIGIRLIDKSARPTQTSKALVVWARTLELMDRMGCKQAFLAAGLRAHGASLRSSGAILGHARFDAIASAYNFALMIPQRETERLLIEHLATFGVAVEREVELVGFVRTDDQVEATLRHADGAEETVSASWLIGCDGAHSTVRHGLDLAFKGEAQGDDWLLADIRVEGDGAPPGDEIATYLHRDGPLVVFPIPGGRARVIAQVGKTDPAHPRPDPTLEEVQALADRRAGGFRVVDPVWLTHFRINERKVSQYAQGRAVLAGDAAHIHSPAGGQGMNTGMQDAINLAWKLAMVQRGQAAPSLLDSYSPERNAVGDRVLRNAARLTDMATLSNPVAQEVRNLALRFMLGFHVVQDRMAATMSEVEIAYPDSPLSHGPQAGMRWAPAQDDGKPPGSGSVPLFVLYAADSERGAAFAARFPALLEPAPRHSPEGDRLILVRPDGYVGFSGTAGSWDEAERYLSRLSPDRP